MSDLRTRIAAALQNMTGPDASDDPITYEGMADAVIRELDMVQETNYGTTYPRFPVTDQRLTRWVTKWKAADD